MVDHRPFTRTVLTVAGIDQETRSPGDAVRVGGRNRSTAESAGVRTASCRSMSRNDACLSGPHSKRRVALAVTLSVLLSGIVAARVHAQSAWDGTVEVSPSTLTVKEGESVSYRVRLTKPPTGDADSNVWWIMVQADGARRADGIYKSIHWVPSIGREFNPDSRSGCAGCWDQWQDIRIYADQDDDAEDLWVTFTHEVWDHNADCPVHGVGEVTVHVIDDDGGGTTDDNPAVTVSYRPTTYTMVEGETVPVTVVLSADPEREVVIPIAVEPGGTATTADYSGVPTSVTFASGETTKAFTVMTTEDTADEPNETVNLGFGSLPTGVSEGSSPDAVVTIIDDDNGGGGGGDDNDGGGGGDGNDGGGGGDGNDGGGGGDGNDGGGGGDGNDGGGGGDGNDGGGGDGNDDGGGGDGNDDTEDGGANRPPVFARSYAFDLLEHRSGREVPVFLGTVRARDPDGDRIRYALSAGDRERFTVSTASGAVSYVGGGEEFESGPSRYELQVTAEDGALRARADVVVRVVDVPEAPDAGDDDAETPEDTPTVIDVLSNDRDPDGDRLRIASVGAAEHGTATLASGGIRYAPDLNWHGTDRFDYTVADAGGLTSTGTVTVRVTPVNDPPEAVDDEAETLEDVPAVVDVLANDTDVDGDRLRVVAVGSAGHGATAIASRRVRYSPDPNWYGTDRFRYTIADPEGLTATAMVTVTVLPVNDPPEAVGVIPDQALEEGGAPGTVDLAPYFTDVDGDALTYAAVSSDETAVTVTVAGATVTLSAVVTGTATVTVTASDVEGLTATQTFSVQVGDRLVRAVMTDALAALGRGHLSSARSTIGRHLEMGGGAATRLMVGGQLLSPDAWDRIGAGGLEHTHELLVRAAQWRQRVSGMDLVGTSAEPRLGRSGSAGLLGGESGGDWNRLLQGTDVLLSFGGQDGPPGPAGERVGGRGGRCGGRVTCRRSEVRTPRATVMRATCGPGIWGWMPGWARSGWWVRRWRAAAAAATGRWARRAAA